MNSESKTPASFAYPFTVSLPSGHRGHSGFIHDQTIIRQWCDNTIGQTEWRREYRFNSSLYEFNKAEDATLFALKWA